MSAHDATRKVWGAALMISFDKAVELATDAAHPLGVETVALAAAHGRVLASPVVAQVSSPAQHVSAMDGYAVRDADVGELPARLPVAGQAFAGRGHTGPLPAGATVRIFTGAPVPDGTERVVIQENVRREGGCAIVLALGGSRNIRAAGSDFAAGELLIEAGALLNPRAIVAAAAADLAQVEVFRRPRVRLLATGDELAEPGTARSRPQAIPESVSFGVAALARDWGADTAEPVRVADDLELLEREAQAALDGIDILVVTGGASVGERDFAKAMFGDALELIFSKVAIKPGKPVWLGRIGATLILGLPGNPTSALVTARLFLAPLLAGMSGRPPQDALRWWRLPLAEPVGPTGDRETFSRARLDGERLSLLPNQDSGAQKMLVAADLLVRRPAGVLGYGEGELLNALEF
jgi:molybdopterin molybdotransferase